MSNILFSPTNRPTLKEMLFSVKKSVIKNPWKHERIIRDLFSVNQLFQHENNYQNLTLFM